MKKTLIPALVLAFSVGVFAADDEKKPETKPERKRPALTEEQKQTRKEIVEKYDKNKDGKLDGDERKSISQEDREKMRKAGLGRGRRSEGEK